MMRRRSEKPASFIDFMSIEERAGASAIGNAGMLERED
jgi:hypothetical protein